MLTGYQQEQKKKNIKNIIEVIQTQGDLSRINIAKRLELDRSTVTNIVPKLLHFGILKEIELKPTGKGGRPPSPLRINPEFGYTLGISIHLKGFHAAVLDLNGNLIESTAGSLPFHYEEFSKNCIGIINRVADSLKKYKSPVIGAVIAISGVIDPSHNRIERSYVFNLYDFDFQREVDEKFAFPVFVENDANACAWGELFPQKNHTYSSFLYLLARTTAYNSSEQLDTGMAIGIGVVVDSRIIYGSNNRAGELRSALWTKACGTNSQVSIPMEKLSQIHKNKQLLREFIDEILISLGPVVSVMDPEAIIFGGDLKKHLPIIHEELHAHHNQWFLGMEYSRYSINAPSKGDYEVCAGAACMFLSRLFRQDLHHTRKAEKISWNSIFHLKRESV